MPQTLTKFDYQNEIDIIRIALNVDFIGIAMPFDLIMQSDIKWHFVSGAQSLRYKKIELKRGKGVAGYVIKTGKPWVEFDVAESDITEHLFDFPIIRFESLTSFAAMPLWKYNKVAAVLLLGNRNDKPLNMNIESQISSYINKGFGAFYHKDVINHEED